MFRREMLQSAAALIASAAGLARPASAAPAPSAQQPGPSTPAAPPRPRPPFMEASDGTRLFYRDWGPASGSGTAAAPPVVFLAPWAMTVDWFEYQMTYLASQGLRCIGYDRRGHGRSDDPGRGYDFPTLAADLATLIDRLDLRGITLVGHSMGAGEMVRYLTLHGQSRIARLVLIAPITPGPAVKSPANPDGVDRGVLDTGRDRLAHDRPGQIAKAAAAFFGTDVNPSVTPAMMQWWVDMLVEQCSLKVMIDLHRMFTETDFHDDLRKITVPTLVIHGDHDTSCRLEINGRPTAQLIAGSRLIVYEHAAHALPVTHIDRLNADLLAFAKA